MAKLNWDTTPKDYFMGVSRGVLYLRNADGTYAPGVAWNGIRAVTETPTGGEISKIYADDMVYGSLRTQEGLNGRIEVYDYPTELNECTGWREPIFGTKINLQKRKGFGFCYRTSVNQKDYQIHIIYGVNLNPGENTYKTISDNAEVTVHGFEFFTIPEKYKDSKPASSVVIDSRKQDPGSMEYLEGVLYGTDETSPRLPNLEELIAMSISYEIRDVLVAAMDTIGIWMWDTFYFPDDSITRAVHRESETRVVYGSNQNTNLERPGITYELLTDESNPYPDRTHYRIVTDTIPSQHSSMIDVVEDIPYTTLIDTQPSTDGYVFNIYSTYYKEET